MADALFPQGKSFCRQSKMHICQLKKAMMSAVFVLDGMQMALLEDIVNKQKDGAQFVISAQMLHLDPEEFDTLVHMWLEEDGLGFELSGVPHRKCVDGEFFIDRITVRRIIAPT